MRGLEDDIFWKGETQPCLLGSLPLWLKQGLFFMASSSPPLADSLRVSVYVHQDSLAAQQEVPYVGEMCRVRDGLGGEGGRVGALWFHQLFVN